MKEANWSDLRQVLPQRHVLVVGDVMLDRYWFGDVDRISPEAPVPVVRVNRTEERLGGAANVARNVKALGSRCTLVGPLGDDEAGHRVRALLLEAGIDGVLGQDPGWATIVKLRVIGRAQQLLRADFEKHPDTAAQQKIVADVERTCANADVVVFSDYGKGGLAQVSRMIEAARRQAKPVLIDPKGLDFERYRGATLITPNRAELAAVVGGWSDEAQLRQKAQALRASLAMQALLLTRSDEGMTLFEADRIVHLPARAREVFDVTGAGDTVIAALATLVAAGMPLVEAAGLANRAGGIVVGKFGTASVSADELFATVHDNALIEP